MSGDPVTKLLDIFYDAKQEASKTVNSTINTVVESKPFRSLQVLVFGDNADQIVRFNARPHPPPSSFWGKTTDWIGRHKLLTSALAVALVGGSFYSYVNYIGGVENLKSLRRKKKRRAKRAPNGARKEVVLIAGSPAEPVTRIIANDLEKRGFIVYWTTSSPEEEALVAREKSSDIRSLPIKPTDVGSIEKTTKYFSDSLRTPVTAFQGAAPHYLKLKGIVVVPDLFFPAGPVETVRVETWSELFYAKIMGPIVLLSNGLLELAREHQSRVVLVSPSIMGDINAGFHSAEAITSNALSSLALCMHRELKPQGVPFVHLKLGSFNVSHGRSHGRQIANAVRADILSWSDSMRGLYGQPYQASSYLQVNTISGSNLRTLHHALFDALTDLHPKRLWYAGKGAYTYHFLSNYMPEFIMTFLLQPPKPSPPPPLNERDWEHVQV